VSEQEPQKQDTPDGGDMLAFASMGLTVAVVVGGFLALGIWLDSVWKCTPVMLFVGLVVGLVVGALVIVSNVKQRL
jgi:F0F1-type ATP synthase assembly protein I